MSSHTLLARLQDINDAVNNCISQNEKDGLIKQRHLLSQDALLDSLLVLYDECSGPLKKLPFVSEFLKKYKNLVSHLRTTRVNSNDFEQRTTIGKGRFGVVKVVREKHSGNFYAMKILQKSEITHQQHVAFYEEERDIMAKAISSWITHLHYSFQDDKHIYFVMDFHPGGDLLSLLDRFNGSFTTEMTKFYLAEVAVAIQALHNMGYVHRDIKPENILIDRYGHIKLADFGSAAKLNNAGKVTSEMPVGTPDYIAPEVLLSMNEKKNFSYGNELKFPNEVPVGVDAKDLIKQLLTGAEERVGYAELIRHKFFLMVNWNNLLEEHPPFIPVVTSLDDTSNFEEISKEEFVKPPSVSLLTKSDFSGENLLFIGFTFSRRLREKRLLSDRLSFQCSDDIRPCYSKADRLSIQPTFSNVANDGGYLYSEHATSSVIPKAEIQELTKKVKILQEEPIKKINDLKMKISLLEKKNELCEKLIVRSKEDEEKARALISGLKSKLSTEKKERAEIEAKTLEIMKNNNAKIKGQNNSLIQKVKAYEEYINDLSGRLSSAQNNLIKASQEILDLKRSSSKKENACQTDINSLDDLENIFKLEKESYNAQIKSLTEELESFSNENKFFQNKLTASEFKEEEQSAKIIELQNILATLNRNFETLKDKQLLCECKGAYQAKLEIQEKTIDDLKKKCELDKDNARKTQDKIKTIQEELVSIKLELRVAQRELKSAQDSLAYYRDTSKELRTEIKMREADIENAKTKENELIKNLQECKKEYQSDLNKKNENLELLIRSVNEFEKKILILENDKKELYEAKVSLKEKKEETKEHLAEKDNLQKTIISLKSSLFECQLEKKTCIEEKGKIEQDLKKTHTTVEMLKKLCSEQDEQLTTLDVIEKKIEMEKNEKVKLCEEIENLKNQLKTSRSLINEEKSLKIFQVKKSKDLEQLISSLDKEHEAFTNKLKSEVDELKKENTWLSNQIIDFEKRQSEDRIMIEELQSETENLRGHIESIEKQLSVHISHIHSLKESNFDLTENLETAISKGEGYKQRIEELQSSIENLQSAFDNKELQLCSTIGQQSKLIDFLQVKSSTPKPKKKLSERIFGSTNKEKENNFIPAPLYKDLEDLLKEERKTSKRLREELSQALSEIQCLRANSKWKSLESSTNIDFSTPTTKKVLRSIVSSPPQSEKRMKHRIPHRWQPTLIMKPNRCAGCLDSIPFAHSASKCQECATIAHTKCSVELPSTCGLPSAFIQHYSTVTSSSKENKCGNCEGWMRLPKSGDSIIWERKYVIFNQKELLVYSDDSDISGSPEMSIKLFIPESRTSIISIVPKSELPQASSSDLPYTFKVNIQTNGVPQNLYFMTTNFQEKQKWVTSLEQAFIQFQESNIKTLNEALKLKKLTEFTNLKLDVCSIVFVGTVALVGTSDGLYSYEIESSGDLQYKSKIGGVSEIHQLLLEKKLNEMFMISGLECLVVQIDTKSLMTATTASINAKPYIVPKKVSILRGCHLLSIGIVSLGDVFMCAAAADRISILIWDQTQSTFVITKQYSTQEPCSCFLFTKASLIVGAEKFFEIDLKHFTIEEFLDETDPSLKYAIYGQSDLASFPVAIIQISEQGKYEEYLMCFYEYAIFVDPHGRRSREYDIKFTRLPAAVVFQRPYLYAIHQNAIEAFEINSDSYTKTTTDSDIESEVGYNTRTTSKIISRPVFIGCGLTSGSICISTPVFNALEIHELFPDISNDTLKSWCSLTSISCSHTSRPSSENVQGPSQVSFKRSTLQTSESASKKLKS